MKLISVNLVPETSGVKLLALKSSPKLTHVPLVKLVMVKAPELKEV
jgi:hypothetical protein